jgi:thiamine pyrophosphokinase
MLVGAGERPPDHLREQAEDLELVAVDKGAHWVLRWGLVPSRVVGDMDSLDKRSRDYADRYGTPLEAWEHKVGRSDLSRAVDSLLLSPPQRVVFTGCVGWRLDHVLGVFYEMARLALAGVPVRLVERWGAAQVAAPGVEVVWDSLAAERASFFPLSPVVRGLQVAGFDEADFPDPWSPPGPPLVGVPIVSDPAEVSVKEGALAVVVPRREDPDADSGSSAVPTFRLGTFERTE